MNDRSPKTRLRGGEICKGTFFPIDRARSAWLLLSDRRKSPMSAKVQFPAVVLVSSSLLPSAPPIVCQTKEVQHSPPGQLVDIGGYKLHINCCGNGKPTVVLLHGLGDYSFDWALVQPEIARITRVCAYDRAAVAWSDPGPPPRGPLKLAQELHALLGRAGESAPYVLVGHSWGGLIARVYASQYPQEVAGVVLVDATHEDAYWEINGHIVVPRLLSGEEWLKIKPKAQLPRGPLPLPEKLRPPFDRLPPEVQNLRRWAMSLARPANVITGGDVRDIRADLDEVYRLTRHKQGEHPLGDVPLTVITKAPRSGGPIPRDYLDYNMKVARELSRLSRRGRFIVAQTTDHHIQLTQPELVISAIRDVIAAARNRQATTTCEPAW